MNNNFCPNCGAQLTNRGTGTQNFCPACGTRMTTNYDNAPAETFTMKSAYKSMFKKYAKFNGRSRRSEYWYATLANSLIIFAMYLLIGIIAVANGDYMSDGAAIFLSLIALAVFGYSFAVMIPGLAMAVRRLHDTGRSGWFMLLSLIPYIGGIILFVFMVQDSQPGANQYGTNPKEGIVVSQVWSNNSL